MSVHQKLEIKLHNWRVFDTQKFALPSESFVLCDQNGSGKTSLTSAVYTLFTGQSWPNTKFQHNLRSEENYFGISTAFPDWSFTGQISSSGRIVTKFKKPSDFILKEWIPGCLVWPKIFTYLPTDNFWFYQSRSNKLAILDNLLIQVYGDVYAKNILQLDKLVKSKSKLIKHYLENKNKVDEVLVQTLGQEIYVVSMDIWNIRRQFFSYLSGVIADYSRWIQSPFKNWECGWEITDKNGFRENIKKPFVIDKFTQIHGAYLDKINWIDLWKRETASGKVLFGAQRDDFFITSKHKPVQEVLSRGEMRLLVLFIKKIGMDIFITLFSQNSISGKPFIFWFLDDVFNELDSEREQVFFKNVLSKSDYFLVTTTRPSGLKTSHLSLSDLQNF